MALTFDLPSRLPLDAIRKATQVARRRDKIEGVIIVLVEPDGLLFPALQSCGKTIRTEKVVSKRNDGPVVLTSARMVRVVTVTLSIASKHQTHLSTNNSKLSFNVNVRWSFNLAADVPFSACVGAPSCSCFSVAVDPTPLLCFALDLPFLEDDAAAAVDADGTSGTVNFPDMIASNSSGVGGARLRHMSDMMSRFLISALKTCKG